MTPGPWEALEVGVSDAGPNGVPVYEICGERSRICEYVSGDDAFLIAAAPKLLAALMLARSELAGLPHSLGYEFTHLPEIDAAIAMATRGDSA